MKRKKTGTTSPRPSPPKAERENNRSSKGRTLIRVHPRQPWLDCILAAAAWKAALRRFALLALFRGSAVSPSVVFHK